MNHPLSRTVADPDRIAALDALAVLDTPAEEGFDDVVRLAARLCLAPVALVSLVGRDRQWFKARIGFPPCETDLERSVCKFVLDEPDLLVIPDLTADPRTRDNPLVTGEPRIRFYAGAPLRRAGGQIVGSLCVIDTVPRPQGLIPEQADDLRALARQVVAQLELRAALRDSAAAAEKERRLGEALRRSESRNRLLLETIDAGFCVIELRFEGDGPAARAVDYRFLEVNSAFERLTGLVGAAGRWMRELAPGHEQHWFDVYGRVALTGEPARFESDAAALDRCYDVHALRVGEPHERQVAILFADISARRRAEIALRASESRFRALVNAGAQSIYRMSPDWQEMRALDGAGFLTDTLAPSVRWLDLYIDPADRPTVTAATQRAIRHKDTFELEHRVRRADGSIGWTLSRAVPILDERGEIAEWFGAAADVSDRRAAQEALRASEAHWRGLFERLSEGFVVGEVIRGADGAITDWRYVEVNQAWGELVGVDARAVVGRTIREVFPGIEDDWVNEFAEVVRTGEPVAFTRQVGMIDRWYEGRAFPLEGDRFGVIFLEVTERAQAGARREALLELGDRLRETADPKAMAYAAAEIMGRTLGASRAGYGTVDARAGTVMMEPDWCRPGVASASGLHRFADYGSFLRDLERGEIVVLADVETDPRTCAAAASFVTLGIRTLVNVPLIEHGVLVAVLFIHDERPRLWEEADLAFVRNVADRTRASIARMRAEEERDLLNQELSHRLKNTLAMVLSIATQTLRSVPDQEPVEIFERRIHALSSAHEVLLRQEWAAAPLEAVARAVLGNVAEIDRVAFAGPEVLLGPRAALSVSLVLHELATNAVKYGALSNDEGRVAVTWRTDESAEGGDLMFVWEESGGPPVTPPTRRGFGARLIRMGLIGTGEVELGYDPSGFRAEMRACLSQIRQS